MPESRLLFFSLSNVLTNQGRQGRFLAGKAASMAAILPAYRQCRRLVLFRKIEDRGLAGLTYNGAPANVPWLSCDDILTFYVNVYKCLR